MSDLEMDSTSTFTTSEQEASSGARLPSESPVELLQSLYEPVADSLAEVEDLICSELQSRIETLAPLLRHGTQLGGKRMRPAMVLLSAKASGGITREHIAVAAGIEMVHTATLIHDDVLDGAETRRHVPTINARWDNHTSILLGDYLFAQSFRLAAIHSTTEACAVIGEAARRVCEGELRQVLQRDILELDEESYFEIIRGKTAELCRAACEVGASRSGADREATTALANYGMGVGIAFQIADDCLDLWGDGVKVGKTLGTDLQQGKMTLPLIRLLETATDSEREQILAILTSGREDRQSEILPWLESSNAFEYTAKVAGGYARQAIDSLRVLPDSDAKDSLRALANFAVERKF